MWTLRQVAIHQNILNAPTSTVLGTAPVGSFGITAATMRGSLSHGALLGACVSAVVASAPAQAGPIVTWSDPDGWFEVTGSVDYPIGTTTKVDFYAVYRIPTSTDAKGVTTIDYSKSTVSLIQKTGPSGFNGFTTLPIAITDVKFVNDTKGPLSSLTFASALFDPQVPAGYSDKGISGTIDFTKKSGSVVDNYTNDTKKTNITHTTSITDIVMTQFDIAGLPPPVERERVSFVVKNKIPAIPAPAPDSTIPEPSTISLLGLGGTLALGAGLRRTGKRRQPDPSMND